MRLPLAGGENVDVQVLEISTFILSEGPRLVPTAHEDLELLSLVLAN